MNEKNVLLGIAAVAAYFLWKARKVSASPLKMVTVSASTGRQAAKFSSYEGDVATWAKKRYQAAHDYLLGLGFDEGHAHDMALSALAHWALETGSGAQESNFNVGNIHASGDDPWFQSGDTDTSGQGYQAKFASYPNLASAVKAYFALLQGSTYTACWQKLQQAPEEADWYKCLGQNGYYAATLKGKDNLEPAAAGWAARRALLAQYATAPVAVPSAASPGTPGPGAASSVTTSAASAAQK